MPEVSNWFLSVVGLLLAVLVATSAVLGWTYLGYGTPWDGPGDTHTPTIAS